MHVKRKTKSLDIGASQEHSKSDASTCPGKNPHRHTRSNIPKPPEEAPLFRNDAVDRFYSKIPYPSKRDDLFYDVLEESWRRNRRSEGDLPAFSRSATTPETTQTRFLSPSPTVASLTHFGGSIEDSDDNETPKSNRTSHLSAFQLRNCSFTSQSTVLDYGSDMFEPDDWRTLPKHDDDNLSDASLDSKPYHEANEISRRFLQDCANWTGDVGNTRRHDVARVASAREVHETEQKRCQKRNDRPTFRKFGRFCRRAETPSSHSEEGNASLKDLPWMITSKNSCLSKSSLSRYFQARSVTPSDVSVQDVPEDISVCAMRSEAGSAHSFTSQSSAMDHYEAALRKKLGPSVSSHDSDRSLSDEKPTSPKVRSRRHRMARWLGLSFDLSFNALLVLSGAALAHMFNDRSVQSPSLKEENDANDIESRVPSLSNYAFVSSGLTAESYPVTLVDPFSDEDP